jgi:hypothetical protein
MDFAVSLIDGLTPPRAEIIRPTMMEAMSIVWPITMARWSEKKIQAT